MCELVLKCCQADNFLLTLSIESNIPCSIFWLLTIFHILLLCFLYLFEIIFLFSCFDHGASV